MTRKEIVQKWYASIDSKDFETAKSLMHESHLFHNPLTPPQNPEEHVGMMQMMTSALDGNHIADFMIEDGNWVAVQAHWKGTHVGEFNGVPATGNKVEFSMLNHFEIIDGKVAREYLEMNPMSIMAQIGTAEMA